jgi:tetratricopeptide (TPR) repeat protein
VLVELPPRARSDAATARGLDRAAPYLPWLVALIALLPHGKGVFGGWVYDDFRFVVENPGVHTLARPAEFFTSADRMSEPPDHDIWRPLRTLLFAAEWRLFGGSPAGFHAVSLLLFLLLVRGVVALARRLPGVAPEGALAAGLLFGLHPVTVESVAWISSQGDLLAAGFIVASLLLSRRRPWLALVAAALALLSKELALPLCAVLFLAALWWREGERPKRCVALGALLLAVATVVVRQHVLARGFGLAADGLGQVDAPISSRLFQSAQNVVTTLRLVFWPHPLSIAYDDGYLPPAGALDLLFGSAAVGVLAALLLRTRAERARTRFALAFALLFFLPTSGLLIALKAPLAERFLLLPLAGVVTAVAAVVPWRIATRLGAVVAAVALAVVTSRRTGDFVDDASLWRSELAVHPRSIQAQLGMLQIAVEGHETEAARALERTIVASTRPGDARRLSALFGLGQVESDEGNADAARALFQQVREEVVARGTVANLDPTVHLAWVALANEARASAGPEAAAALLDEGIGLFGRQPRLLQALGVCLDQRGDAPGAERLYREALGKGDDSAQLRYHLALALVHQGRSAEARRELEHALTLAPWDVSSRRLLDELSH